MRTYKTSGVNEIAWTDIGLVLAAALALRVGAYSGFFGSDEVTYVEQAFKLMDGDWTVAEYVGANRFGMNLPMAALAWLFGPSEASAAAWAMSCSIAEVAVVMLLGQSVIGRREGMLAGLLLATLPLHVHYAGRIMADAPLALAITAGYTLFFVAERRQSRLLYGLSGLAAGLSFWIKPHAAIYLLAFASYPLVFRRFSWRWAFVVAGFAMAVGANLLWMRIFAGDAMFLLNAMAARQQSGYLEAGTSAGSMTDAAGIYVTYLFAKVHQTWLLGPLALAGMALGILALLRSPSRSATAQPAPHAAAYLVWWATSMVLMLSLLPVSLRPLILVPKQVNYMLMFVAPLCLLAALALGRLAAPWRLPVLVLVLVLLPAVLLSLLQQASVLAFTANSRSTLAFARNHPEAHVHVGTQAQRAATFEQLVRPSTSTPQLWPMAEAMRDRSPQDPPRYAVFDANSARWASNEAIRDVQAIPACWTLVQVLPPAGLGPVNRLLLWFYQRWGWLPNRLLDLAVVKPAVLYQVPAICDATRKAAQR